MKVPAWHIQDGLNTEEWISQRSEELDIPDVLEVHSLPECAVVINGSIASKTLQKHHSIHCDFFFSCAGYVAPGYQFQALNLGHILHRWTSASSSPELFSMAGAEAFLILLKYFGKAETTLK